MLFKKKRQKTSKKPNPKVMHFSFSLCLCNLTLHLQKLLQELVECLSESLGDSADAGQNLSQQLSSCPSSLWLSSTIRNDIQVICCSFLDMWSRCTCQVCFHLNKNKWFLGLFCQIVSQSAGSCTILGPKFSKFLYIFIFKQPCIASNTFLNGLWLFTTYYSNP